jgi:histidinol-phosphate aminotransferase
VGYALGDSGLIEALDKTKDSYNIAYLNQIAATQALLDYTYMETNALNIIETRQRFREALADLGFDSIPTSANFIMVRHEDMLAKDIYQSLQDSNILVRYFNQPRLWDYIRISIGTDEQMQAVLDALKNIISQK